MVARQSIEYASEIYKNIVIEARNQWLPKNLAIKLPNNQVAIGFSPDKNKTEGALAIANKLETFPQYINYYTDSLDEPGIFYEISDAAKKGIVPIISCGSGFGSAKNFNLFTSITKNMESLNTPYIIRPYFEINGEWTRQWWGEITPKEFVNVWKEMYIAIKNSSKNAHVAFCLNSSIYIDPLNHNHFEPWFPGPEYMDLFAIDIYNKYSNNPFTLEHYQFPDFQPDITIGPDIEAMNNLAPDIPKIVTEINCLKENKAHWLKNAVSYLTQLGVNLWISFDWDKEGNGETRWNTLHYPTVVEAYRKELQKPHYISSNKDLIGKPEITIQKLLTKYSREIS